jgi:hypothetical protein
MAFLGARLGLELIFDQMMGTSGTRLLQFRCGAQVIEVTHRPAAASESQSSGSGGGGLTAGPTDAPRPDTLWGIAWAVDDIEGIHARLMRAGLNLSPVRVGAKRGTRVFTIRDGTCGVPTLVVQTLPKAAT